MGKLIALGIVVLLAMGTWQWVAGVMEDSRLDTAIHDTLDNAKMMNAQGVQKSVLDIAQRNNVKVDPQEVHVKISFGQPQGISGTLTQSGGIRSNNKKIQISVDHTYRILGIGMTSKHDMEQNYIVGAELQMQRSYELGE